MDGHDPHPGTEAAGISARTATTTDQASSSPDAATDDDEPGRDPRQGEAPSESSCADAATDGNDPLLELLQLWEEGYRRGEDPAPETLGVTEPVQIEALRSLIRKQKRLYARLNLVGTPADGAAPADEPLPSFPGYEILGEIGRGGMGVVYQARDVKLGRIVAIKTIAAGQQATPEQRDRFRAEAHAVARLHHPNIIAIHAIDEHEKRLYLSLEFAEGGSLDQRLAEKPMAPREAAALIETLARAVHAAHQAGVVHRDLKPSNVLMTSDGVPKVSDFGLAKLLDSDSGRTLSGQVMGTPRYMAPEQAEGRAKQVGPSADVYALGAILYHALTGRPPFWGESAMETLKLVTSTEAVPPRRLRPDVPRDLETICLKCLEKEPHKRYVSALALADDLRRFLEGRTIAARPVGLAGRLWRWSRRNPVLAGLVATLVLTFAIGTPTLLGLWLRARADRARAESQAEIAKAVNEFLQKDMLAQASAYNQARFDRKPDPELKVRTALDRAAETIGDRFAGRPLVEASIRLTIGEAYSELGLYPQARPHLERALKLRRSLLGSEDHETFLGMLSLGRLLLADGKSAEAERVLVPAMAGLRRTRGTGHPETLSAMHAVGELYYAQNKLAEAEALLVQAGDGLRKARGAEHPETLQVLNILADLYVSQNKPAEAERLLDQALEGLQEAVGGEHPTTLQVKMTLATTYDGQRKREEAERLLREVLQVQRRVLGGTHPDTLATMVLLGELLVNRQNKLDEAEPLLLEAREGCRQALDRNHLTADAALASLSSVYSKKKDFPKLGAALVEALEITRFRYGPDDALTVGGNQAVGAFFLKQHEFAKAEPYLRDTLAYRVKTEPDHWRRFWAESMLGECLVGQKNYAEAERRLLSACTEMKARRENVPPQYLPQLGRTMERLIQLYDAWGQKDKAEGWRRERIDSVLDDPFAPP